MVWNAFETVLPIFLLIAFGNALARRGFLPPGTTSVLSRLVFYVATPALLFRGLATSPLSVTLDPRGFLTVAWVSAGTVVISLLLCSRMSASRRGVVAQGAYRSNTVMIGLPVVSHALGEEALAKAAALVGVTSITYNLLAVIALGVVHPRGGELLPRLGKTTLGILRNPLVVASSAGIGFALIGVPLAPSLERSLELVGSLTVPLALLVVGADLDPRVLRSDGFTASLVAAFKLLLYPGLMALSLLGLGAKGLEFAVPVLITAAPTAVISVVMAREMEGDHRLATSIVVASTLGSVVTLPLWLMWVAPH